MRWERAMFWVLATYAIVAAILIRPHDRTRGGEEELPAAEAA